ncbi:MAG: hypothetical protein AAF569_08465 [Pseudomonadota bacterium]
MSEEYSEPRFIEPQNTLKIKVGHGGIPPAVLKKSQDFIESNATDFVPYADEYLDEIEASMRKIKDHPSLKKDPIFLDQFAQPIMGLKSNGGMFKYPLISMIADVTLQFLDRAGELNEDGMDIIRAHNGSIRLILKAELKGYAGPEGQKITMELSEACNRYFKKHKVA